MQKFKLTIPNVNQIENSVIVSAWGKESSVTDFAALQGTFISNNSYGIGNYWIKDKTCGVHDVNDKNNHENNVGLRLVASYSQIKNYFLKEIASKKDITESEIGLFPQYTPSKELQEEIIGRIKHNELVKTSLKIPINVKVNDTSFKVKWLDSYFYNEKIYTLSKARPFNGEYEASNGILYHSNDEVVTELSPIKILSSLKENLSIFEDIIIGSIQLDIENNFKKPFSKTNLYNYINRYLLPFIIKSIEFNFYKENYEEIQKNLNQAQTLIENTYSLFSDVSKVLNKKKK